MLFFKLIIPLNNLADVATVFSLSTSILMSKKIVCHLHNKKLFRFSIFFPRRFWVIKENGRTLEGWTQITGA
jgi:hypothetical protein